MDYGHGKIRMNIEGDRLSSLPDDLIHKILSFIDIKHAIETSALSSRWRYIWTSMPCLNFSSKDFHTSTKFSKFVTHALSLRKNHIEVSSFNLTFHGKSSKFVEKFLNIIMSYEFSHNVQQLNITSFDRRIKFPLSLFSSQSLKHLTLSGCDYEHHILTTPTWELPTLTTLYLHRVTFYVFNTTDKHADLFSNFANLKNLTLNDCRIAGLDHFNIYHPKLSNLTLENGYMLKGSNLVTPQLKNLMVRKWRGNLTISAPDLTSLGYEGYYYPLELSGTLHLEKVDICISSLASEDKAHAHEIVCLLQQLHSVKFLKLNIGIIKCLSSFVELISHQPSPFTNLKSLKIYPDYVTLEEEAQQKITTSTEVKNYLLDRSPCITFTMVSPEEMGVVMNVASALKLMGELQVLLDQCAKNSETNTAHMKQKRAPMETHMTTIEQVEFEDDRTQPGTITKPLFGERMAHINEQFKKGYENTSRIISMLRTIEEVLKKLPTSHQAKLQVRFSSLCAEAETIMDLMVDGLKIQCKKKPRLIHELATASQPSS